MNAFISVIIPVFNDPDGLADTVDSLVGQDYDPRFFEIIVVDNGSTDRTPAVAGELARNHPALVKVLREPQPGSYAARNRGVADAQGEVLCFLDADMTAPEDYLSNIDKHFAQADTDYLGCRVEMVARRDTLAAKYEQLFAFPIKEYLRNYHFVPTCCLSVRRAVIGRLGAFDARLESGGDLQFGHKVHAAGFRQAFAERIALRHPVRWRFRALLYKAARMARGQVQLSVYFPEAFGSHLRAQFHPALFFPQPGNLRRRLRERGLDATLPELLLLSVLHIPLNLAGALAAVRERLRLQLGRGE